MFGENMWGMFGTMHAILAIAALLFNVLIYFILRKQSKRKQIITLFLLSLLGLISLVYNFVSAEKIHEALPLNWWSISALLLPIAILTRGKRTTNILLLWSLSSIIRIAFKNVSSAEWFNLTNSLEFITDVIVAGFPILIFELDLAKRNQKTVKFTMFISTAVYFATCITNIILNTNYMSSAYPTNDFLRFIYSIFYVPHWYMLLIIPFLLLYLFWWYIPEILDERRKNRGLKYKLEALDEYYEEYEEEFIEEIIDKKYD